MYECSTYSDTPFHPSLEYKGEIITFLYPKHRWIGKEGRAGEWRERRRVEEDDDGECGDAWGSGKSEMCTVYERFRGEGRMDGDVQGRERALVSRLRREM